MKIVPWKTQHISQTYSLINSKYTLETIGGDASWINGKNERHNIIIHDMVRSGFIDINKHENKCCCEAETSADVHRCRIHSALENIPPHFAWYGKNPIID